MKAVATYTMHILLLFVTLSIHTTHASYALDPTQEAVRTQMATLVCTKQNCSCESYTPLATEVCRLLSLNKKLTHKDVSSLDILIVQKKENLIEKAPECASTVFHLLLSCRPQFGCLHGDGTYLSSNIIVIMKALIYGPRNGIRPYSRQFLLAELTNAHFRTPFDVATDITALAPVKEIMKQGLEEAALGAYWRKQQIEKGERDRNRKALELQATISLI